MKQPTEVLHPELFDKIPFVGGEVRSEMARYASEAVASPDAPKASIVIRTRNEKAHLEALLDDIQAQEGSNDTQVIVVDNESTDGTKEVAEARANKLITIPKGEFTYPKSMNLGVEAADNPVVYLTVGHALMSTAKTLIAARNHFKDPNVAGVFANVFPGPNASLIERLATMNTSLTMHDAHAIEAVTPGVMGATSAALSKEIWEQLGRFDERYESGGEDTVLAHKMLDHGYDLIFDPLLNVHHSHGLGPINGIKQIREWGKNLKGPVVLDKDALLKRRPDLRKREQS
ncbi:MAG: glycosyl transferase [Candidatus Saccharibacteria bacterium]|nr:glycosyl transferase [Candidatus Saccharibacteria bacterium]